MENNVKKKANAKKRNAKKKAWLTVLNHHAAKKTVQKFNNILNSKS